MNKKVTVPDGNSVIPAPPPSRPAQSKAGTATERHLLDEPHRTTAQSDSTRSAEPAGSLRGSQPVYGCSLSIPNCRSAARLQCASPSRTCAPYARRHDPHVGVTASAQNDAIQPNRTSSITPTEHRSAVSRSSVRQPRASNGSSNGSDRTWADGQGSAVTLTARMCRSTRRFGTEADRPARPVI